MKKVFSLNKYRSDNAQRGNVLKLEDCPEWALICNGREVINGRVVNSPFVCGTDDWTNSIDEKYLRR